jgi:hypothetical protein
VLRLIIADERATDGFGTLLSADIAHRGQLVRIAFTGDDGADNAHAGGTSNRSDYVVQLNIHEGECLLHVLDVRCSVVGMALPDTKIGAQFGNVAARPEACSQ